MCLLINRFVTLPLQLTHTTSTIFNAVPASPTAHTPCSGVPCRFSVIPSPALPYFVVGIRIFSALTIAYALLISISPNRCFRHPLSELPYEVFISHFSVLSQLTHSTSTKSQPFFNPPLSSAPMGTVSGEFYFLPQLTPYSSFLVLLYSRLSSTPSHTSSTLNFLFPSHSSHTAPYVCPGIRVSLFSEPPLSPALPCYVFLFDFFHALPQHPHSTCRRILPLF